MIKKMLTIFVTIGTILCFVFPVSAVEPEIDPILYTECLQFIVSCENKDDSTLIDRCCAADVEMGGSMEICLNSYNHQMAKCQGEEIEETTGGEEVSEVEVNEVSCGQDMTFIEELGCVCDSKHWEDGQGSCRDRYTLNCNLDFNEAADLEDKLNEMETNTGLIVTIHDLDGKEIKLAIMRLFDGQIIFSQDGERYFDNLNHMLNPSLARRAWQGVQSAGRMVVHVFSPWNWRIFDTKLHDEYTGEDRQIKWEVARDTLKDYERDIKKPARLENHLNSVRQFLVANQEHIEDIGQVLVDSGLSAELAGTVRGVAGTQLAGALNTTLTTFPAQAVIRLQGEFNTDDWAEVTRVYMRFRQQGMDSSDIALLPPEELIAVTGAREMTLGRILLYTKFEETYQRYLLRCQIAGGQQCDQYQGESYLD